LKTQHIEDEKLLRLYLLGELPTDEQQQLEERLLTDDDYFQQLVIQEDELVDDYVSDNLSSHEREKFNQHFLSTPERQQQLRFATMLRRHVSSHTAQAASPAAASRERQKVSWANSLAAFLGLQNPALGLSLATALVLTVIAGSWLALKVWRLQSELAQTQAARPSTPTPTPTNADPDAQQQLARQRETNQQLSEELKQAKNERNSLEQKVASLQEQYRREPEIAAAPSKPRTAVFPIFLTSGGIRSDGESTRIDLGRDVGIVRATLDLPGNDYKKYQAVLQTVEGRKLWTSPRLQARAANKGRIVILNIPARFLKRDDYQIKLSGVKAEGQLEEVASYPFGVN
jgi:hypothetical protein